VESVLWRRGRAIGPIGHIGAIFPVDDRVLVPYDLHNTGKEVILKYMSSYHSEVAAA
jgi:hypothetical protein